VSDQEWVPETKKEDRGYEREQCPGPDQSDQTKYTKQASKDRPRTGMLIRQKNANASGDEGAGQRNTGSECEI